MIRNALSLSDYANLRVVIIDTHGEYTPIIEQLSPMTTVLDIELRKSILEEEVLKELLNVSRKDDAAYQRIVRLAEQLDENATLDRVLEEIEVDISVGGEMASKLRRVFDTVREQDEFCLWAAEKSRIVTPDGRTEYLSQPGLYLLDLRLTDDFEIRAVKAAVLLEYVFQMAKETQGQFPTLVIIDEAQNYAPEQHTGWLKEVKPAFDAVFRIASEGRKFGVGLIVSTQRAARVNVSSNWI